MQILLEISALAVAAVFVAKHFAAPTRGRLMSLLKAWVTLRAFWLLLTHPVTLANGSEMVALRFVWAALADIDTGTFWTYATLAAGTTLVGTLAAMYRWILLLRGQSIELPFRHIFGSFLIGRFIGTFLPGSTGLDGYKLYDAARFSGKSVEVATTAALEKLIGLAGIFLAFLVALPFGIEIFGESARVATRIAIPFCLFVIGGLMLILFFPGTLARAIVNFPIPGKARLAGLVTRASTSAAAYHDKRALVTNAFALSFVVHFSKGAMFYFTALAIGSLSAEFWPIALGPSVQILATLLSPFAGEGLLQAAQHTELANTIGPSQAVLSVAVGFLAAEALTLFGGVFWWIRGADYKPVYCLVDGQQANYAEAVRAAANLIDSKVDATAPELPTLANRMWLSARFGLGVGILSGLAIGIVEALVVAYGGFGEEAQVLWYAPLNSAAFLGFMGFAVGAVLGVFPMDKDEISGWTPALAMLATFIPCVVAIALFQIHDVYEGQLPPGGVVAAVFGVAAVFAIAIYVYAPQLFRVRFQGLANLGTALSALLVTTGLGIVASVAVLDAPSKSETTPMVPPALADRPNVILVLVDSLRADQLSCYGGPLRTPAICSLVEDGGTMYNGDSHSSETKRSTASILASLAPSIYAAMPDTASLPADVTRVSEVMQKHGYVTGGIVSNGNLAPGFGFDRGFDEYHYLAPDTLNGAEESSSKLILYNIFRSVVDRMVETYRFGDFYQDSGVVNEFAFDFLSQYRMSRFFLFLNYMDLHDPYFEHPYNGYAVSRTGDSQPDPTLAAEMKRLYEGELEYLDANFQKLLTKLRDFGIYDDTVIALVSDHGEASQEKQNRVAILVKWAKDRVPTSLLSDGGRGTTAQITSTR